MLKPEAILFDLDGVLVDTEEINKLIWEEVIKEIELNLTASQINSFQGRTRKDCANIISKFTNGERSFDDILRIHLPIFEKQMKGIKEIPYAKKLIFSVINMNIKMAIVSSSSTSSFEIKAMEHKWLKAIEEKVLGDNLDLKKRKPDPEPYLLAAANLKVNIENCWAVEDSISGFNSAFKSGSFVFCLDRFGFVENELYKNKFNIKHPKIKFIKDHKKIIEILSNLNNPD